MNKDYALIDRSDIILKDGKTYFSVTEWFDNFEKAVGYKLSKNLINHQIMKISNDWVIKEVR